jgi:TM2 domain-containing membrane protein YozV
MRNSLKAALLSGLVFPGAGQLWLKHYARGAALLIAVSAATALVVTRAAKQAYAILERIESEGGAIDPAALLKSVTQPPGGGDDMMITAASLAIVACWIIGIVDAYLIGRKKDLAEQAMGRDGKIAGRPGSPKEG